MRPINEINRYFETPVDQGIDAAWIRGICVLLIVLRSCWEMDTAILFIVSFFISILISKKPAKP